MTLYIVYELWDSDNNLCIYVGKTSGNGRSRYRTHMHSACRLREGKKVQNVILAGVILRIEESGGTVEFRIVSQYTDESMAFDEEKRLIALYGRRIDGTGLLTNMSLGGDGVSGVARTPETIAKWAEKARGQKRSDETRRRMSEAKRGRPLSTEHRRKIGEANLGNVKSKEARRKSSDSQIGVKKSPEHVAKLRGRTRTPEQIENIKAGQKVAYEKRKTLYGKVFPEGSRPNRRGFKQSEEHIKRRVNSRLINAESRKNIVMENTNG